MARAIQPYLSFTTEGNEVNFYSSKIVLIDSMLADNGQKSTMLLEI